MSNKLLAMLAFLSLVPVASHGRVPTVLSQADSLSQARTTARPESEADVARMIRSFYAECVFGRGDYVPGVESCCTERLCRQLREAFSQEYDGEGYAVWNFRTGCQDGPSEVSEVTAVTASGENVYRVDFIDMGIEGRRTVHLVRENGVWKIDALE